MHKFNDALYSSLLTMNPINLKEHLVEFFKIIFCFHIGESSSPLFTEISLISSNLYLSGTYI